MAFPCGQKQGVTISKCRACGSADLIEVLDLGEQFVSDFVEAGKVRAGIKCPIEIVLCRGCGLVQQLHTAPQDFLYTRYYWYRSGVTETMRRALEDVADAAKCAVSLNPGDLVLDIGSNDGTLLECFGEEPVPTNLIRVGVEPATNLNGPENYEAKGILCVREFWPCAWHYPKAKVITACGMMYDTEDPNAFVAGVAEALRPDGVFIAQLMCLKNMLVTKDLGNLCHEHLEFWSLRSLQALLEKHGLGIVDVWTNRVNGESYRLHIRHQGCRNPGGTIDVAAADRVIRAFGGEVGLDDPVVFARLQAKWEHERRRIRSFVESSVKNGKRVWVYGASTKGNVLLQWWGLDNKLIGAAVDKSPEKWGKFMVGTGIPIVQESDFRMEAPDYALVLPYAFIDEFRERERAWLEGGGAFLVPLPEFHIVTRGGPNVTDVNWNPK